MEELMIKQSALVEQFNTLRRNFGKTPAARRTRGYVSKRLESVEQFWETFCGNDVILREFAEYPTTKYATEGLFEQVDEAYFAFSGDLADLAHGFDHPVDQLAAQLQAPNPVALAQRAEFRLPQISIPTFSGGYESWTAFHDMFVSLIHSNGSLTNVQKLHYLKCNLSGQAANLLRHTPVTNDNYDIAWQLLQNRFANKKSLVDAQLKVLINQPSHVSETASTIRELIDRTQESLNALQALEIDTTTWDPLLMFIIVQKLSKDTHQAWESSQQGIAQLPAFAVFITFLENRFRMLETLDDRNAASVRPSPNALAKTSRHIKSHATVAASPIKPCPLCSENHYLRMCTAFLQSSVADRRNIAKQKRICFNCLVHGHFITECKNRRRCQVCNQNHHTLLHQHDSSTSELNPSAAPQITPAAQHSAPSTNSAAASSSQLHSSVVSHTASHSARPAKVLLATAIIKAVSSTGDLHSLRALIDQGSEVSFLTENAAQLLQLPGVAANWPVHGIGNTYAGRVRSVVQLEIRSSHHTEFALRADTLVMKSITGMLPHSRCTYSAWPHIANLTLADPTFATPGTIDILLGGDVYKHIIMPGMLKGADDAPLAQSTVFGWILSGQVEQNAQRDQLYTHLSALHTCIDIDTRLKSFWEIEECSNPVPTLTEEERKCEDHFVNTHSKSPCGRYIVRLPVRPQAELGESRNSAVRRLHQTERRLNSNPALKTSYIQFMREYASLGHMELAEMNSNAQRYYIPHHAVFKESSSTTKVRVVFDASSKSTNGYSLNDLMYIGPKIQDDLSAILLRWRKYPFAYTADVEKMYRQVLVHQDDRHFQHILWRESPEHPIAEYALRTITYGTSCAPHLAVRTLQQLANDNADTFPLASHAALNDFYVDDLMSGAYTEADSIAIIRQLYSLMSSAGLKLRKWVSNCSSLLTEFPAEDREIQEPFTVELDRTVTALGIIWNPVSDHFNFVLNLPAVNDQPSTKRIILSDISKLFDPLGWLSPVIVRAKILMQQLWVKGVGWDDPLPDSTINNWQSLRHDLFNVSSISINRWICHHNGSLELHGFSDASTSAYAAAIYARIRQPDGQYHTTLLTSKTRVAPLKQISIPRLELCGAVLVAELLKNTQQNLQIPDSYVYAWTDSSIVLHWLRAQPSKWKTFVANRVSAIQQIIPISSWRHVPTADNPADCASRGLDALSLRSLALWWNGPPWLRDEPNIWPKLKLTSHDDTTDQQEQRIVSNITSTPDSADMITFLESFSSMGRLLRITAYCKRFIAMCRKTIVQHTKTLSADELHASLVTWIVASQKFAFHNDIHHLLNDRDIPSNSKLRSLNPFIDQHQVLRVGGRLQNSSLSFAEKHPIVMSNKCHLTKLIIRAHHLETMHGGSQLVLCLLRKKYWVLNAKNTVRLHIHRCITCHRHSATGASQLMGSLPEPRVNFTRAFTHTGVDYAGPIDLRMSKGRGNASYKGYISLFVCLCTKAIHIEAVSDLTSNAFIAAYRRFVSRRGLPAHMYSDNGTNFVGAVKALRKSYESCLLQVKEDIINNASRNNTEWHFIPPSSPHFGGLWEAGVKSLKHHLKRSVQNAKLTYEELSTLLTQIEACLNSRPLAPLSTDPNDFTALTPGHFLIGDALLAMPDRNTINDNISLLSRWQLVQRMYHAFAIRWQTEYLSRLQQRPKWTTKTRNIQTGDLVLLKEPNIPPSKWPLARIIATHPGADNLVRVVTVRTATSTFKRCITKICPLPF